MLAVAAELAGVSTGRNLQDLLAGLDRANTTLVIRAVLHASRGADTPAVTTTPFRAARTTGRAKVDVHSSGHRSPGGDQSEPDGLGL